MLQLVFKCWWELARWFCLVRQKWSLGVLSTLIKAWVSSFSLLVARLLRDKSFYMCMESEWTFERYRKDFVPIRIKKLPCILSIIHFHLFLWSQKLNGENKATEILILEVVFLNSNFSINSFTGSFWGNLLSFSAFFENENYENHFDAWWMGLNRSVFIKYFSWVILTECGLVLSRSSTFLLLISVKFSKKFFMHMLQLLRL